MRRTVLAMLLFALPAAAGEPESPEAQAVAEAPSRPTMRQLPAAAAFEAPPSARRLVDARTEFDQRYPGLLARGRTSAGAPVIAEALIEAAISEEDRGLKWLMLAEARRMAVASGSARSLERATLLASATFEFDAAREELRGLEQIPVRLLAPDRAASFAEVAERLAGRAEAEGRRDVALDALGLAVRGWQRAGAIQSARNAANTSRHIQEQQAVPRGTTR